MVQVPATAIVGSRGGAGGQRPFVLGHRGASAVATENTLAAFRRAMADGADGVELDVQRCKTGEVVVFHDEDLRRLGGRPERIDQLAFAELRRTTLAGGGEIPTLDEALDACGPRALVNVEIKYEGFLPGGCAALVRAVAESLARAGAGPRVVISSFSPAAVWLWQKLQPSVDSALLFDRPRAFRKPWPLRTDLVLPFLRPRAVHPEAVLCTPRRIEKWHRQGYRVVAWTVDNAASIEALSAMGVDGIISNDPGTAKAVLALTPRSTGG